MRCARRRRSSTENSGAGDLSRFVRRSSLPFPSRRSSAVLTMYGFGFTREIVTAKAGKARLVIHTAAMKDMTQAEARAEAQRRWGVSGTIAFRPSRGRRGQRGRLARYPCFVGNGPAGSASVEGQGATWREAFDDVRQR